MKSKTIRFDGTGKDIKLWHTYVYWAKSHAQSCSGIASSATPAIVDDLANRVGTEFADALATVLFSSFALEYRLRRVLAAMGIQLCRNSTLGQLLGCFWSRLGQVSRLEKTGPCAPPAEWRRCERTIKELVELRNALAHGNYQKTLEAFGRKRRPSVAALKYYNAVIDAIRLINEGAGYDPQRSSRERRRYFEPLKVRR